MGCRCDDENDTYEDLKVAREKIKELERDLCECRSLLYIMYKDLMANSQDKQGIALEDNNRIQEQLDEHREHRAEEQEIAIKSKKRKLEILKDRLEINKSLNESSKSKLKSLKKMKKQLDDDIEKLSAVDSADDEFWDRNKEAFVIDDDA